MNVEKVMEIPYWCSNRLSSLCLAKIRLLSLSYIHV